MTRHLKKLVIVAVAAVVLVVGGTWVYINVIREDAPPRLALEATGDSSEADATGTDGSFDASGTWTATTGSQAGYRVDEVLFGQDAAAVGRTDDVSGTLVIDGTKVKEARIEVDLTTVESDQDRRDNQFHGRIMDTATFPTATFELSEPIELDAIPADDTTITVPVDGKLTLRGTTKDVSVELTALRTNGAIKVQGSIPIVFAEWGIPNPSFGPVTTEDHGELEFLVAFSKV